MLDILKGFHESAGPQHPVLRFGKNPKHMGVETFDIIFHGVNDKDFFVLPEADVKNFRKEYFKENADKFIFTNVNRNQQRKDIPRTVNAFRVFHDKYPNTFLYLHMAEKDFGWHIPQLVNAFGLRYGSEVMTPQNFGPNKGYPVALLNYIYNASDCGISTTLGEGMGLGWLEFMLTKTPVIMPSNTAMSEFITDDTGYLVKSGTHPNLLTVIPNDNEVVRPMVDIESMVTRMNEVFVNRDRAKEVADNAYKWVKSEMLWTGKIRNQWLALFNDAVVDLKIKQEALSGSNTIKAEVF